MSGDFNGNGTVDAADYVVWRKNPTSTVATIHGAPTLETAHLAPAAALANGVCGFAWDRRMDAGQYL